MTKQEQEKEQDFDLIAKKLSGSYGSVTINIPWDEFESFVESAINFLAKNHNVHLTRAEVFANKEIHAAFQRGCEDIVNYEWDWYEVTCNAPDAAIRIYHAECDATAKIEREAKEKAMREAQQQKASTTTTIGGFEIPLKNVTKAKAILLAAGLIK